jgi:hypothetical protein
VRLEKQPAAFPAGRATINIRKEVIDCDVVDQRGSDPGPLVEHNARGRAIIAAPAGTSIRNSPGFVHLSREHQGDSSAFHPMQPGYPRERREAAWDIVIRRDGTYRDCTALTLGIPRAPRLR